MGFNNSVLYSSCFFRLGMVLVEYFILLVSLCSKTHIFKDNFYVFLWICELFCGDFGQTCGHT